MDIAYVVFAFVQSFGVSLGVGASTIAVLSYLTAVRDGIVDDSEKRLLKVVYVVLRLAMSLILLTMFIQGVMLTTAYGTGYFHPFVICAWAVVFVLYANAVCMTMHIMPRVVGPALQAGSWYTLAILYFLSTIDLINFSYMQFFAGYAAIVFLAMILINGAMAYFKIGKRG